MELVRDCGLAGFVAERRTIRQVRSVVKKRQLDAGSLQNYQATSIVGRDPTHYHDLIRYPPDLPRMMKVLIADGLVAERSLAHAAKRLMGGARGVPAMGC